MLLVFLFCLVETLQVAELSCDGDTFPLITTPGRTLGMVIFSLIFKIFTLLSQYSSFLLEITPKATSARDQIVDFVHT